APGVGASVPATTSGSDEENLWHQFEITASLREGTNVIAAEVHRFSRSEADLSFDLQLMGRTPVPRPRFASLPRLAAGGGWTVEVVAEPGDWVDVERSSDLRSWTTVASVVPARGEATVTLQPDSATRAFFRLRER
ncbi:MAG: hypothetical protein JNL97_16695, partial [Verrucomicrobiales bacterium]|nr:hypothetical protein [Verrucomicrobiales bacterium]